MNSSEDRRVAFVSLDLWVGGGTVFILKLATALQARGIKCHVFGLHARSPLAGDFEKARVPVSVGSAGPTLFEDRLSSTLSALRNFSPTSVICDGSMDVCELARYVPAEVQKIVMFHLAIEENIKVIRPYADLFDAAVCVSNDVQKRVDLAIGDSIATQCIEIGVDCVAYAQIVPVPDPARIRVLYLGRLEDPAKRVRLFPRILRGLVKRNVPVLWTIAGDGPERDYLTAEMQTGPQQEVRFAGVVPHHDVPSLFANHDVFLLTSDSESYCLSLHEAMSAGLVPVATKIPGRVSEVVTLETGIPVDVDHVDGYAAGIARLHANRDELQEKAGRARELIQRTTSILVMAERWSALLRKMRGSGSWPRRFKILPPRQGINPLYFSPFLRPVRRALLKFRRR